MISLARSCGRRLWSARSRVEAGPPAARSSCSTSSPNAISVASDILRESAMYSQLRRSAAARRPSMALPGAGGISALALLAATSLPGLLGGRGGRPKPRGSPTEPTSTPRRLAKAMVAAAAPPSRRRGHPAPPRRRAAVRAATCRPYVAAHDARPRLRTSRCHDARSRSAAAARAAPRTPRRAHIAAARDASGGAAERRGATGDRRSGAARRSTVVSAATSAAAAHARRTDGGGPHHAGVHTHGRVTPAPARHTAPPRSHATPASTTPPAERADVTVSTRRRRHEDARPTVASIPGQVHARRTQPGRGHDRAPTATTRRTPRTRWRIAPGGTKPAPAPAPTRSAAGHYVNPLAGAQVTPERIDQGVDYSGSGPLGAIGDGKVTYVGTSGTGWPGAFVEYQLTDGRR